MKTTVRQENSRSKCKVSETRGFSLSTGVKPGCLRKAEPILTNRKEGFTLFDSILSNRRALEERCFKMTQVALNILLLIISPLFIDCWVGLSLSTPRLIYRMEILLLFSSNLCLYSDNIDRPFCDLHLDYIY